MRDFGKLRGDAVRVVDFREYLEGKAHAGRTGGTLHGETMNGDVQAMQEHHRACQQIGMVLR